jgi:4'-phosphopantetheinyl transferase EntD
MIGEILDKIADFPFTPHLVVRGGPINAWAGPVELPEGVAEERHREFSAGRRLAIHALSELGIQVTRIGRHVNGAPSWPAPIKGSITHTSDYVVVALTSKKDALPVGIDLEHFGRLAEENWPLLFNDSEVAFLLTHDASQHSRIATLLFSAKEAYVKSIRGWDSLGYDYRMIHVALHPKEPGQLMITSRQTDPVMGYFIFLDSGVFVVVA